MQRKLQGSPVRPTAHLRLAAYLAGLTSCAFCQAQVQPLVAVNDLGDVLVTGSRIAVPGDAAISPVYTVDATLIQQSGVTRIEDLLNSLPQVTADQGANASMTSDGTAAANLRGLGSQRTLVLVNGRRLGPGDPGGGNQSDLNAIPADLIEKIDLLTGGASSVYGADAVAGVVNFKLLDHFEGVRLKANYDFYSHTNDDTQGVIDAINASNSQNGTNYALAPGHVNAGFTKDLSFLAGANSPDGMGNAVVYATYRNVASALQGQYSYSDCALASGYLAGPNSTGGRFQCAGSLTSYPGAFWEVSPTTGQVIGGIDTIGPHGALVPFTNANFYNYGPLNYFLRPDERYGGGAFAHYEFNEHATVYSELQYMDDDTIAQIAPSGSFFYDTPWTINCNNPELSASMVHTWCGGSKSGDAFVIIGRRNTEAGGRRYEFDHSSWRFVIGAKGRIDDAWGYDISGQYGSVHLHQDYTNDMSLARIANALQVVDYNAALGTIGTGGTATCTSALPSSFRAAYPNAGTDMTCVPWNIFQPGGVTSRATNYLAVAFGSEGNLTQEILSANVTGDLGTYGLRVPTAKEGIKVNVGTEWREVSSANLPDREEQSGDAAGCNCGGPPLIGAIVVGEAFAEMHVPLADGRPLANSLDFETGYRYSDYTLGFDTGTYKFGLEWAPVRDIWTRASWSRAVRAPNVGDLFSLRAIGGDGSTDPCSGAVPQFSLAACERTGVTPAEYGNITPSPTSGYNGLTGGNPHLGPEVATTFSYGIGWRPSFIPGLHTQLDYYNIKLLGVIGSIGADTILRQCLQLDLFCNLIHRDANGSLWLSQHGYVIDAGLNVGEYLQKGIDIDLKYDREFVRYGKLRASVVGSYLLYSSFATIAADPATGGDCTGYYGTRCGAPNFRWRHTVRLSWETPWRGLETSVAWRYFDSVVLDALSQNPNLAAPAGYTVANGGISNTDAKVSSRSYLDVTAAVQLATNISARVGVNNVLDKDPPVIGTSTVSAPGNTFFQVYDVLGRYVFATISARF
jgi:outer membrane receptor protein involved in Fe transport